MKHARPDYNRFQDPTGLIPKDEPVMLFRGQDIHAPTVLDFYAMLLEASQEADPRMIALVKEHAQAMRDWHRYRRQKFPDLLPTTETEIDRMTATEVRQHRQGSAFLNSLGEEGTVRELLHFTARIAAELERAEPHEHKQMDRATIYNMVVALHTLQTDMEHNRSKKA